MRGMTLLTGIGIFAIFIASFGSIRARRVIYAEPNEGCAILINGGLGEPQPLILSSENETFAYPDHVKSKHVTLRVGEQIKAACPGSTLVVNELMLMSRESLHLTCVQGKLFSIETPGPKHFDYQDYESAESENVNIGDVTCASHAHHEARRTNEVAYCKLGDHSEIGFPVGSKFHRVIEICHDDDLKHTVYAHFKIPSVIDSAHTGYPRPNFLKGPFFKGIPISNVYKQKTQFRTFSRLLGGDTIASKYLQLPDRSYGDTKASKFLTRGHLVAKADMIYGSQQRSTFYYVNAVPSWNTINAGNYLIMEQNLRKYATRRNVDLEVWAGALGVLKLEDINGQPTEIYLFTDDNNNVAVPVPNLLFKVAYEPRSKSGIVFLTANNPYLEELTGDYVICPDVSEKIDYMPWKRSRSVSGLSYSCEIDEFRKAFPHLPDFATERLLV